MELPTAQRDRAGGVLLGTAAGEALGAGYEFGPPLADDAPVAMKGGGGFAWEPGEWTDDTSMAVAIAEVAAAGADLRTTGAQDRIVARWAEWAMAARDIGTQTARVLGEVRHGTAAEALAAAAALQAAWCGIAATPVPAGAAREERLRLALEAAVRGGRDADTVAAIAGGLLGAACGASAVPAGWQAILHGWPGATAGDLAALAAAITSSPVAGTGPGAAAGDGSQPPVRE